MHEYFVICLYEGGSFCYIMLHIPLQSPGFWKDKFYTLYYKWNLISCLLPKKNYISNKSD